MVKIVQLMKQLFLISLIAQSFIIPVNKTQPPINTCINTCSPPMEDSSGLTGRKWELDEIRFLQDNIPYYYKKGDYSKSSIILNNDYIIFNEDGTGAYYQGDGITYSLKWQWVGKDKKDLEFTILKFRDNSDLKVTWEKIELNANSIRYTEYYKHKNGSQSLASATRINIKAVPPKTACNTDLPNS